MTTNLAETMQMTLILILFCLQRAKQMQTCQPDPAKYRGYVAQNTCRFGHSRIYDRIVHTITEWTEGRWQMGQLKLNMLKTDLQIPISWTSQNLNGIWGYGSILHYYIHHYLEISCVYYICVYCYVSTIPWPHLEFVKWK